jgi:predicted nucleic acid-binding Zn ribbon protein
MKHAEFFFDAMKCTMHVVLHRNGDPIHFNVTVDFQRVAEVLGGKAEENRSHVSVVAGGFVTVRHEQRCTSCGAPGPAFT